MSVTFAANSAHVSHHPFLFDHTPPSSSLTVSIVVPVRNEAHHLPQTLDALRQQQSADGQPLPRGQYEVLMLINNCSDQSMAVARRYQRQFPLFPLHLAEINLPVEKANIGTVRRLLMDEAYRRLMSAGKPLGIIASTDGDTIVDTHWVYYTIQEIARGNDAVSGRILTRPDGNPVRLNHLRDVTYRTLVAQVEALLDPHDHDPWPRHFQHFGASLAVTCRMYHKAGRLPNVPHLEDEAFYQALLRTDARVRKSTRVKVVTSTRLQGRVAVGFSEQLRYWTTQNQLNHCQVAEPAEAVIIRLRNRHRLRQCWQSRRLNPNDSLRLSAIELGLDHGWLAYELKENKYFGQLWEKVNSRLMAGHWASRWPSIPITEAIQGLRDFLRTHLNASEINPAGKFLPADAADEPTFAPLPQSP